ncbi:MAG TPA: DUF2306 domain-containing protein [Gemmatimonadales bacterium]|nr:DUF2306 domain-containing protein [Gemmatimonadales bacterium]
MILLSMVPAIAGSVRVAEIASGADVTPANARFIAAPIPVVLHIVTAIVFSFLGALQLSPAFRKRRRALHRVMGRIVVPAGFVVAATGLWMTLTIPSPPEDGLLVYLERLVFGTAMLASMILGVDAIRRRDFTAHGAWMMRAYAIGLGAGTQVLTHLPWFILVGGKPGELPRAVMMGAGWVINVMVAEWVIRRPRGIGAPAALRVAG